MPQFNTPSSKWAAVRSRDPLAANAFIYCVASTKIYCRPNCPSRLARRANVIFHNSSVEAEKDGYRACLRCRPAMDDIQKEPQKIVVAKACDLIKGEIKGEQRWGLKELAKEVGLTESHFCRVFKKATGVTVGNYRRQCLSTKFEDSSQVVPGPLSAVALKQFSGPDEHNKGPNAGGLEIGLCELAPDWFDFCGNIISENCFEYLPGMDSLDFHFPEVEISRPQLLSDQSLPTSIDDGLQFLNLDFGSLEDMEFE